MKVWKEIGIASAAASLAALLSSSISAQDWAEPDKIVEVEAGDRGEANVTWWGFDEADSTPFVQAALDSGADRVVVPAMETPWIVEPLFVNRNNVEIRFEEGAVLEAKKGSFRGRNDSLLTVRDREDIRLVGYGAVFRMHKEDYMKPPYPDAEWRNTLAIRGCTNVTVLGLTLRSSGGDGIYIGSTGNKSYVEDVTIRDVVCDDNTRQGMTVISAENLLVERCVFSNTWGTNPGAGIDLEPNGDHQRMVNVVIRNCLFENNSLGMHMWFSNLRADSRPVSVLWENNVVKNHVRGYGIGIHVGPVGDDGGRGQVTLRNNKVLNTRNAGIHFRNKSSRALRFVFENNVLFDTATGEGRSLGAPVAPVALHARSKCSRAPGGIEFIGLHVVSSKSAPGRKGPVVTLGANSAEWDICWTDVSGLISSSLPSRKGISTERAKTTNCSLTVNRY